MIGLEKAVNNETLLRFEPKISGGALPVGYVVFVEGRGGRLVYEGLRGLRDMLACFLSRD